MTSVLFENSTIVTLDDSNSVFDTGWVFVKDGIIEDLNEGNAPKSIKREAAELIDAQNSAIMTGMINGHTHLCL